jgi:hypothetical protein
MPLTQSEREHAGAVEVTRCEEDTVEVEESEEAEMAKEGVGLQMMSKEVRSTSLSRNPSPREELAKSKNRRCHHRRHTRTWPTCWQYRPS